MLLINTGAVKSWMKSIIELYEKTITVQMKDNIWK